MTRNKWYVVTGGPSVGKTTLLEILRQEGHAIFPEAARVVIDEGIADGLTVEQIRKDEKQFQLDVLRRKLDVESRHNPAMLTFFDRGMHDTLAYMQAFGMKIEKTVKESVKSASYQKVFLLAPLENFVQDYARTEDKNFRKKINNLLHDVYTDAGMEVIKVPVLSPENRADFILKNL